MTVQRLDLGLTAPATGCSGDACMCGPGASSPGGVVVAEVAVEGMTCSHCVRAVTEEISALDGVTGVEVDLVAGGVSRVTVHGTAAVPGEVLRSAVGEAGYTVAG